MTPDTWKPTGIGRPLPAVDIKIVENPSLPFRLSRYYRGDIFVRGPNIPFNPNNPPDEFGWVQTSCLGQWDIWEQTFRIIGESADLRYRYLGDYVPTETLESIYKLAPFVQECILVYTYRRTQPIAMLS